MRIFVALAATALATILSPIATESSSALPDPCAYISAVDASRAIGIASLQRRRAEDSGLQSCYYEYHAQYVIVHLQVQPVPGDHSVAAYEKMVAEAAASVNERVGPVPGVGHWAHRFVGDVLFYSHGSLVTIDVSDPRSGTSPEVLRKVGFEKATLVARAAKL